MRIDRADPDRLTGFAEALARLFWCLMVVGFFTAILGSAGTGLFVLIIGAGAFVLRAGLEDFVRSRLESAEADVEPKAAPTPTRAVEPAVTIYRAARRRRTKSVV